MKNLWILGAALTLSLAAFSACGNDHSKHAGHDGEAVAASAKYICPMNCEKGKTYDQPGTCPVCNMNLEPMKEEVAANKAEYFTTFNTQPAQLEAGKAGMLSFTPKIRGNEGASVPLDLVHEKKMHLILASDDLSWFDHLHPEYTASGSYDLKVLDKGAKFANGRGHNETRFDQSGKYWAFADYKPVGALNQVNSVEFEVAGIPGKATAFTEPKLKTVVDGYTISLEAGHGNSSLAAGSQQHFHAMIVKGGTPADPATFENYLGEKAHLILIEVNSKAFVHTHPSIENGELAINTTFPEAGTYRAWLQFQTNGKVHTADFVLKVGEGNGEQGGHEGHEH